MQEVIGVEGGPISLKANKRSAARLISLLKNSDLAVPIWTFLAMQRDHTAFNSDHPHLKLITTLLDQIHTVFLQYGALMSIAHEHGLQVELPHISTLLDQYKLGIDLASFMHRRLGVRPESVPSLQINTSVVGELDEEILKVFWFWEVADMHVPQGRYNSELLRLKTLLASPTPPSQVEAEVAKWRKEKEKAPQVILNLEAEVRRQQELVAANRFNLQKLLENGTKEMDAVGCKTFYLKCLLPRSIFSPSDAVFTARFLHSILTAPKLPSPCTTANLIEPILASLPSTLCILTEREAHNHGRFLALLFADITAWHSSCGRYKRDIIDHRPLVVVAEEIAAAPDSGLGDGSKDATSDTRAMAVEGISEIEGDYMEVDTITTTAAIHVAEVGPADGNPAETAITVETQELENTRSMSMEALSSSAGSISTQDARLSELSYEDWRHRVYDWHVMLQTTFKSAFESGNYSQIRNSIIILTRICDYFPLLRKVGASLERVVNRVRDREVDREDLKVLATRYSAMLHLKRPSWHHEDEFHFVPNSKREHGEINEDITQDRDVRGLGSKRSGVEMDIDQDNGVEGGERPSKSAMVASLSGERIRSYPSSPRDRSLQEAAGSHDRGGEEDRNRTTADGRSDRGNTSTRDVPKQERSKAGRSTNAVVHERERSTRDRDVRTPAAAPPSRSSRLISASNSNSNEDVCSATPGGRLVSMASDKGQNRRINEESIRRDCDEPKIKDSRETRDFYDVRHSREPRVVQEDLRDRDRERERERQIREREAVKEKDRDLREREARESNLREAKDQRDQRDLHRDREVRGASSRHESDPRDQRDIGRDRGGRGNRENRSSASTPSDRRNARTRDRDRW